MSEFCLPDLGEGLQEAEVVAWHVGPGDHVVADQPLVAVETDKAVVEIPSPRSGHIAGLCASVGDIVRVGEPLVDFTDVAPADKGTVVGHLDPDRAVPLQRARPAAPAGVRAAPAIRDRARRLGVELAELVGTGPDGTITGADLDRAAHDGHCRPEPLRGVRRAMASNMARAHRSVVPATVTDEADIGEWLEGEDGTTRLVRAVGAACKAEPALNMSFHGTDAGVTRNDSVDLGLAVDTHDGLFVPVLRDIGNRAPEDLRTEIDALKVDVDARALPPDRMRGQTITLSNFGTMGGRHASLVVVPPQVAIIGAGRIRPAVVVRDGEPAVRRVLPISITFDHRVVTGGEAARFLTTLIADLESPT